MKNSKEVESFEVDGYLTVELVNSKGVTETKLVHELVAQAFVENPNNLTIIRHIDGDKLNNRADNLEWVKG